MTVIKYVSQNWFRNTDDIDLTFTKSFDFVNYWSGRSCGLACASMLIRHLVNRQVSMLTLLQNALVRDAYNERGLIHFKLADLLTEFGIPAKAIAANQQQVLDLLDNGNLFIASVRNRLPVGIGCGGHLMLFRTHRSCGGQRYLFFNDPSSWGEVRRCISVARAFASYSGRGIVIGSTATST